MIYFINIAAGVQKDNMPVVDRLVVCREVPEVTWAFLVNRYYISLAPVMRDLTCSDGNLKNRR